MRASLPRALVALLGSAVAVGCSLVVSTDGLTGGDGGAAPSEGGSPFDGPGPPRDGGGGGDATTDGGTRFCDLHAGARLCEDFDTAPLPGRFTAEEVKGGTLALVSSTPRSGRNALESRLFPESSSSAERYASVRADITPGPMIVTTSYAVRVVDAPATAGRFLSLVAYEPATKDETLYSFYTRVKTSASGLELEVDEYLPPPIDNSKVVIGGVPIARDTWIAVEMSVDLVARKATLRVDGALVGTGTPAPPPLPTPLPTSNTYVGIYAYGQHDGWRALFDDVVIDAP